MHANEKCLFGRSGLNVTRMGYGTGAIGNLLKPISSSVASAMLAGAWDAGMRLFDTAPLYGRGLSEHRCGHALFEYPRDEFVLSSKVGYLLKPNDPRNFEGGAWVEAAPFEAIYDYSYDATMRSVEDSLNRLLTHRLDVVLIHDADVFNHGPEGAKVRFREAMNGAYKALMKLRDEGAVKAIGFGVNEWEVCHQALIEGDFDCFLLAGRYTLLEQGALKEFLPLCIQRDVSIILGGSYNSGILATGAVPGAKYNYAPAPAGIMARVAKIEEVCREFEVPLAAAALQFPMAHSAISTMVPATRTLTQLNQNLALFHYSIPADFWDALKKRQLLHEEAPTPLAV